MDDEPVVLHHRSDQLNRVLFNSYHTGIDDSPTSR